MTPRLTLPELARLVAAGEHVADDRLGPAVDAITASGCVVEVDWRSHAETWRCSVWVSECLLVLALPPHDEPGPHEILTAHPTRLPRVLADLVGLGPRRTGATGWPDQRSWSVSCRWRTGDGRTLSRALCCTDTPSALRMITPDGAVTITPTVAWELLCGLLPADL